MIHLKEEEIIANIGQCLSLLEVLESLQKL